MLATNCTQSFDYALSSDYSFFLFLSIFAQGSVYFLDFDLHFYGIPLRYKTVTYVNRTGPHSEMFLTTFYQTVMTAKASQLGLFFEVELLFVTGQLSTL